MTLSGLLSMDEASLVGYMVIFTISMSAMISGMAGLYSASRKAMWLYTLFFLVFWLVVFWAYSKYVGFPEFMG